jgi:hypothetical protein
LNEFWIVNAVVILNVTWTVEFWSATWNEALSEIWNASGIWIESDYDDVLNETKT